MKIPKSHIEEVLDQEYVRSRKLWNADPGRPREFIGISEQKRLINVDPRRILIGDIEVFEDRQRQPR